MNLDIAFMRDQIPQFVDATLVTFQIAGIAILLSLGLAVVNAAILFFRIRWLTPLVRLYTEVARNTPLLIQLFFLFFALPTVGIKLSSTATALISLTFLGGGYMTEIFRAGLEAVSKHQVEAGLAIGLSRWQLLRYVILPQAVRISTPALIANFIYLLKETSVVSAVAIPELLYTTTNLIAIYYKTYEMLLMLTLTYLILFLPLSLFLHGIERRFQRGAIGV